MLFLLAGTASLLSSTQAFGQQSCRATPISGTRTNNAFTVWKDSVMLSPMHSSYSGAESHFAAELEADSTAALAIMQYMRGVWRRPNGRDCGPETDLPPWPPVGGECPSCPPPDTVIVELPPPPPDTVIVEVPSPPDTVIVEVPGPSLPPDTVLVTDTVFVDLPCDCDSVPEPPPPPPDTTPPPPPPPPPPSGDVAWGIGSRPAHPPDGVWVQGMTQTSTRVDWGVGSPESDMGYEITWPGGRIELAVQTWIDLPEAIAPTDTVCVAPGPIGGPYDQGLRSCDSYWQ